MCCVRWFFEISTQSIAVWKRSSEQAVWLGRLCARLSLRMARPQDMWQDSKEHRNRSRSHARMSRHSSQMSLETRNTSVRLPSSHRAATGRRTIQADLQTAVAFTLTAPVCRLSIPFSRRCLSGGRAPQVHPQQRDSSGRPDIENCFLTVRRIKFVSLNARFAHDSARSS